MIDTINSISPFPPLPLYLKAIHKLTNTCCIIRCVLWTHNKYWLIIMLFLFSCFTTFSHNCLCSKHQRMPNLEVIYCMGDIGDSSVNILVHFVLKSSVFFQQENLYSFAEKWYMKKKGIFLTVQLNGLGLHSRENDSPRWLGGWEW